MKNVLITGGSRGIGRAMVEKFASAGYNVAFTYSKSEEKAQKLEALTGAIAIKADSEKPEDIACATSLFESKFGGVDILINNAAYSGISLLTDVSLEEWNKTFAVSMTGAFLYSKAVIPGMVRKKCGRIINITSMWGNVGACLEVAYSSAKAALIGFTKALAKELGPSGITVNAISPGLIDTDMNAHLSKEDVDELVDMTPVSRIGKPEDIAAAALFLASDGASFITGEIMNLSGGFVV